MGQITCPIAKCNCLSRSLDADAKKTQQQESCAAMYYQGNLFQRCTNHSCGIQPNHSWALQHIGGIIYTHWTSSSEEDKQLVYSQNVGIHIQSNHIVRQMIAFLFWKCYIFFVNRYFIALKLMESLLEPCLVVKLFTSWELHCSWLKLRGRG